MKHLKFSGDKETDNIETVESLNETLKDWLESIELPFSWTGYDTRIENFEFRSYGGFHAHRHNCGGLDLIQLDSIQSLIGSGGHMGLSISEYVEKCSNDAFNYLKEENPELSDEDLQDLVYESSDDYDMLAWRIRIMYEGSGVLKIYCGYDKDAPYFRWFGKPSFETEVKFKTISGLKNKLKKIANKIEKAI